MIPVINFKPNGGLSCRDDANSQHVLHVAGLCSPLVKLIGVRERFEKIMSCHFPGGTLT